MKNVKRDGDELLMEEVVGVLHTVNNLKRDGDELLMEKVVAYSA